MPSIIYVEDDPLAGEVVSQILHDAGHHCGVVADGCAALETILSTKPEMIIVDLELPGMSGIEVIRALRVRSGTHLMTILALTAHADAALHQEVMLAGANAVLTKYVYENDFVARVDQVFRSNTFRKAHA